MPNDERRGLVGQPANGESVLLKNVRILPPRDRQAALLEMLGDTPGSDTASQRVELARKLGVALPVLEAYLNPSQEDLTRAEQEDVLAQSVKALEGKGEEEKPKNAKLLEPQTLPLPEWGGRWTNAPIAWAIIGAALERGRALNDELARLISKETGFSVTKNGLIARTRNRLGDISAIDGKRAFETINKTSGVPMLSDDVISIGRLLLTKPEEIPIMPPPPPPLREYRAPPPSSWRSRGNAPKPQHVATSPLPPEVRPHIEGDRRWDRNPLALVIIEEAIREGITRGAIGKLLVDQGFLAGNGHALSAGGFASSFAELYNEENLASRKRFLDSAWAKRTASIPVESPVRELAREIVKERADLIRERAGMVYPRLEEEEGGA